MKGRVFIVESPNPLDLLEGRGERLALEQICKLVGHDAATFLVRDKGEFSQTCTYIGSISGKETDKTPLFLHISVHGDDSGIGVGRDMMSWRDLASTIQEMYGRLKFYHGPVVLVLSACGANRQQLTAELMKGMKTASDRFVPPEYLFVSSEKLVKWTDAVVTWTIFYREAVKLDFTNKDDVQALLAKLSNSGFGNLKYFRWDTGLKRYLQYDPQLGKDSRKTSGLA